jgi:hypothetical protein
MSGLCNHCHSSLRDYQTVAKIFADNYSEVKSSYDNNNESGDSVSSGMQMETANTEIKDVHLMARWQSRVDSEPVKEYEWSDSDIYPHIYIYKPILGKSGIHGQSAWPMDLNGHLKAWH